MSLGPPQKNLLEHLTKNSWEPVNNERKTFFSGLVPRVRVPKRINTEAQRAPKRGAISTSVPSVPLCFKRLDKNVVLLIALNNASLGLLIEKASGADAKYAVSTTGGTISLGSFTGLDLSGPRAFNINQLGHEIDIEVGLGRPRDCGPDWHRGPDTGGYVGCTAQPDGCYRRRCLHRPS